VTEKYLEFEKQKNKKQVSQRPVGGYCPICYESLKNCSSESLVYCKYSCGNSLHKSCFEKWSESRENKPILCIYCRSIWDVEALKSQHMRGNFLNLSEYQNNVSLSNSGLGSLIMPFLLFMPDFFNESLRNSQDVNQVRGHRRRRYFLPEFLTEETEADKH